MKMKSNYLFYSLTVILLSSCILPEMRYGFWFSNDSDDDLIFIMDFCPSDMVITNDSYYTICDKHKVHACSYPETDCWEKYIKDSVYIYLAYLDSVTKYKAISEYTLDDIKEDYFICRMTYQLEEIIDPTHKSSMKTIHYPPDPDLDIPVYYYKHE